MNIATKLVGNLPRYASDCTALIVDNDELVRLGTVMMVGDLGFSLKSAPDGPSALVLIDSGNLPDLLITDYDMPGMTGVELGRTITDHRPDVDVLIITGHDALDEDLPAQWKILHKPFTTARLKETLEAFGIQSETCATS